MPAAVAREFIRGRGRASYAAAVNHGVAAVRAALWAVRMPAVRPWLADWAAGERGRFAPWLPVFIGGGVLGYFQLAVEPPGWIGPAGVAAALVVCVLAWRGQPSRAAACALLAVAAGFAAGQWATARALPIETLPRTAVVLTGTVRGVEIMPEGRRITIAGASWAGQAPLARVLHVRLHGDSAAIAAGDTVRVRAVLRPPAGPAYPGGWDLQREAFFSGLAGAGRALGPVQVVERAPPHGVAGWLQGLRDGIAARVMAALPAQDGGIAATLLTGAASAIPPADRAAFRDSGLAHLLAVAGLHIGIVMALALGVTRWGLALSERAALFWPCKQIAAGAALAAGGGYLLLTGAHVPILRSFAMAALVTLGIALGRQAISLRGLALAATVILLVAPQEVVGVSFQMSFAAVLALIAGYEALRPGLARLQGDGWARRTVRHGVALVLTSLLAGVASAPFGAYHFGHVQLYFILANLVAVPLTALWVMPAGLAALALMPLGLEWLALIPMGWGIDAILWVARAVSALPAATVGVPHLPGWGLALLSLGMAWLGLWRTRLRLAGLVAIVAGLAAGVVSPPADILVSDDARLIGLDGILLQTRPGFAPFVREAWQKYWAGPLDTPFPESGAPGAVRCDADGCRIARGGVAVLLARSLRPMDCTGVALVISAEPARDVCPHVPVIDRFTVWRDGAHAVWLAGGRAEVESDRGVRGDRPWVPPAPAAGRARTTLPLAAAETLSD
jgi:competence protein ComEC